MSDRRTKNEVRISGEPCIEATRNDMAFIRPYMTPAGNIRYHAYHPKIGPISRPETRYSLKVFNSTSAAMKAIDKRFP